MLRPFKRDPPNRDPGSARGAGYGTDEMLDLRDHTNAESGLTWASAVVVSCFDLATWSCRATGMMSWRTSRPRLQLTRPTETPAASHPEEFEAHARVSPDEFEAREVAPSAGRTGRGVLTQVRRRRPVRAICDPRGPRATPAFVPGA